MSLYTLCAPTCDRVASHTPPYGCHRLDGAAKAAPAKEAPAPTSGPNVSALRPHQYLVAPNGTAVLRVRGVRYAATDAEDAITLEWLDGTPCYESHAGIAAYRPAPWQADLDAQATEIARLQDIYATDNRRLAAMVTDLMAEQDKVRARDAMLTTLRAKLSDYERSPWWSERERLTDSIARLTAESEGRRVALSEAIAERGQTACNLADAIMRATRAGAERDALKAHCARLAERLGNYVLIACPANCGFGDLCPRCDDTNDLIAATPAEPREWLTAHTAHLFAERDEAQRQARAAEEDRNRIGEQRDAAMDALRAQDDADTAIGLYSDACARDTYAGHGPTPPHLLAQYREARAKSLHAGNLRAAVLGERTNEGKG